MTETAQETWLWRVTRNKLIDAYRRTSRRPATSLDELTEDLFLHDEASPEYLALRQEEYAHLHETLRQLPALQQEILKLRFVNNMRCTEVATRLGKSEEAVRMILSRTLNQLRTMYNAI